MKDPIRLNELERELNLGITEEKLKAGSKLIDSFTRLVNAIDRAKIGTKLVFTALILSPVLTILVLKM